MSKFRLYVAVEDETDPDGTKVFLDKEFETYEQAKILASALANMIR